MRSLMRSAMIAAVALTGTSAVAQSANGSLTFGSWGGAYARSQVLAYIDPFSRQTCVWVNVVDFRGEMRRVRDQVAAGRVTFDVVDLEGPDVIAGCADGTLQPLGDIRLAPSADGSSPQADYRAGMLLPCAVGTVVFATVIAYDESLQVGAPPATLADFFDLERFPGARGLRRTPRVNLEWALLADGVTPEQVYPTLETVAGLDRAFAVLDRIKPAIVWWTDGEAAIDLLRQRRVMMTSAFNGRVFAATTIWAQPIRAVWDRAVWAYDYWAIPTGAQNAALARELIAFASSPERQALQANEIAYGPARRSAEGLVASRVQPFLPTAAGNMATAFASDSAWWARHDDRLAARFEAWIDGREAVAAGPPFSDFERVDGN